MIDPKEHGVNVMVFDDCDITNVEAQEAFDKLAECVYKRPKFAKEIAIYRKYVPFILRYIRSSDKFNKVLVKTMERYETDSQEKKYKKWTEEEDLLLIELACSDRSMLELSTAMGRTPSSIKTRLSKLVGIKRISQEVAGKFIGTVNGQHTEGSLHGVLYKEA